MKISIIGSGKVARVLAIGFASLGHKVMIGSRDPSNSELKTWHKKQSKKIQIGSTTESASFGEICILALPWHGGEDVIAQIRPQLPSKVVIDLTNPIVFNDIGEPSLSIGHDISAGEIIQSYLPDSHVVKTLNVVGYQNMFNPVGSKKQKPTMFVCGNNKSAINQVGKLLNDMGWQDIVDLGNIEGARYLEPLAVIWLKYGSNRKTSDHIFSVIDQAK